jgi:hypothetical protein
MSDQDNYELGDLPMVSGPGVIRDAETNRRVRPPAARLDRIPRSKRTAEIICRRTGREPTLVGVVTGSRTTGRVVLRGETGGQVGQDLVAPCRCDLDHVIDGGRLRSALLALPARRATRIDIANVERSNAGTSRLE